MGVPGVRPSDDGIRPRLAALCPVVPVVEDYVESSNCILSGRAIADASHRSSAQGTRAARPGRFARPRHGRPEHSSDPVRTRRRRFAVTPRPARRPLPRLAPGLREILIEPVSPTPLRSIGSGFPRGARNSRSLKSRSGGDVRTAHRAVLPLTRDVAATSFADLRYDSPTSASRS